MKRYLGWVMQKEKEKQEACGSSPSWDLARDPLRSKTVSPDARGSQQAHSCSESPRYPAHSFPGDMDARQGMAGVR